MSINYGCVESNIYNQRHYEGYNACIEFHYDQQKLKWYINVIRGNIFTGEVFGIAFKLL